MPGHHLHVRVCPTRMEQLREIQRWQKSRSVAQLIEDLIDDQHRLLTRARRGNRICAVDRQNGKVEDLVFIRGMP